LAVLAMAGVSSATTTVSVGDQMWFNGWNTALLGGPITVNPVVPSTFDTFTTFCLTPEGVLWVNGNGSPVYQVTGMAQSTSAHASWLYAGYLNGSLPDYTNDLRHNNAVQYGLWSSTGSSDAFLALHVGSKTADLNQAITDYNTTYGWNAGQVGATSNVFFVTNLKRVDSPNEVTQDIAVLVTMVTPGVDNPIPEPITMSLVGMGIVGLGGYIRRRMKVAQ
jgi:hypothetical protein